MPEEIGMRTKPELAKEMLGRALDAGVEAAWVVADSVYGDARRLGVFLEENEQPYVLALSGKAHVWAGFCQHRVSTVLGSLRQEEGLSPEEAEEGWCRLSAGDGSKGPRLYDWLGLPLNPPLQEGFERWLLVRRSTEDADELTAYTVFAPEGTTLEALARVAGSRWRVEIGFEEAKGEVGLSHYEVRSWHGWYRHIPPALFAHALLAAIRAAGMDLEASQKGLFWGHWRARTASGYSRESEDSRGVDGPRDPRALISIGSGPTISALGRSALVVGMAASPSGRSQAATTSAGACCWHKLQL